MKEKEPGKDVSQKPMNKVKENPGTDMVKSEQAGMIDVNPEALIKHAIDEKVSIETMQGLLAMRKELNEEFARKQFFLSLAKFQQDIPTIEKSTDVKNTKGERAGLIRYSYAPLEKIIEQVKIQLKENGFSYTLKTKQTVDLVTVSCEAHHVLGHTESTEVTVPISKDDYMNAVQHIGAAITYAKRYAFCNAFGIMTGDSDSDGNVGDKTDAGQPIVPVKPVEQGKPASQGKPAAAAEDEQERVKIYQKAYDRCAYVPGMTKVIVEKNGVDKFSKLPRMVIDEILNTPIETLQVIYPVVKPVDIKEQPGKKESLSIIKSADGFSYLIKKVSAGHFEVVKKTMSGEAIKTYKIDNDKCDCTAGVMGRTCKHLGWIGELKVMIAKSETIPQGE